MEKSLGIILYVELVIYQIAGEYEITREGTLYRTRSSLLLYLEIDFNNN